MEFDSASSITTAIEPEGTAVLLLSGSVDQEWAARAAVDLCKHWAANGRRIVVADLHLETPLLVGESGNGLEGIVDVLLYGASVSRIAMPGKGGAYYLIPAGTYAFDSGEIFRHPRWKKLIAGFRDTGATLLLFAPTEDVDLEGLATWASEAILFGSADAAETGSRLAAGGVKVLGVLKPTAPPAASDEPDPARLKPVPAETPIPPRRPLEPEAQDEPVESLTIILLLLLLTVLMAIALYFVYGNDSTSLRPTGDRIEATASAPVAEYPGEAWAALRSSIRAPTGPTDASSPDSAAIFA